MAEDSKPLEGKMNSWQDTGFLGDDPGISLEELQAAFNHHVVPFLADWWHAGNPIPTEQQTAEMQEAIEERANTNQLSLAYAKLPELFKALAQGIRFNRRNYVNIHPSPFLPSVLASFVVALQNPNNIVEEVSQATTAMENESIQWMAENLFGISKESGPWGNVVSGGTIANMTALLVARDYTYDKLSRPRPGRVGPRGVIGLKPGVVLGTAATHYSLQKALWFLGLGYENLIRVPVCWDEALRLPNSKEQRFIAGIQQKKWKRRLADAIEIDRQLGQQELESFYDGEQSPFGLQPLNSEILKTLYTCFEFDIPLIACVLTLGTTDTGTIERVDSFAIDELRNEDIFIHIDAASGGFAFVTDHVKPQMNNLRDMDSFTVDPHKMGFLHYPCGAVIFKDRGFKEQIYHEAPYLGPLAPTLEGSRPGSNSAALWLAQRTIGISGYKGSINHLIEFTQELANALKRTGRYQVLHKVNLNAVAVAPLPKDGEKRTEINDLARAVRHRFIEPPGAEFLINIDHSLSGVKVKNDHNPHHLDGGIVDIEALRIVVTNPLARLEDAQRLAQLLVQYLEEARENVKRGAKIDPQGRIMYPQGS